MSSSSASRIWIVLPVHNRLGHTREFLDCLDRQSFRGFTLVLVDDGSTDGTADHVRGRMPDCVILRGNGNLWWGGALHRARKYVVGAGAPDDLVLIANNDCTFDKDYLETAWRRVAALDRTLVLSGCHSKQTGARLDHGVHVDWRTLHHTQAHSDAEINVLSTRGLFLKVRDWADIGGFHPFLLPHYGSDYEFTIRAGRKGYRLTCMEALKVWLDETATGTRTMPDGLGAFLYHTLVDKRGTLNVFYRSTYILLACERRHVLRNLVRIHWGFLTGLLGRIARTVGLRTART